MKYLVNQISKLFHFSSIEIEENKLGILRIIFGLILFIRSYQVFYISMFLEDFDSGYYTYPFILFLIILFSFTIGFLTNICTVLIILMLPYFDLVYHTTTLATAISLQLLFVYFFTNHGLNYSIDAFLHKKKNIVGRLIKRIYVIRGRVGEDGLKVAYSLAFLSYAIVSLGALSYHFMDSYWVSGNTVKIFFTGSFLSKHYDVFRYIAINYPDFYQLLSTLLVIGQSIFQLFMIPLLFNKYSRFFIMFWGYVFFISSLFLINLSYLPHVEILLWLAIFYRSGRKKNTIEMFYDDKCKLCQKSKKIIEIINYNKVVKFIAISKSLDKLTKLGFDENEARIWMCGTFGNKKLKGFDLFMELAKHNIFMWPILPLFYIGKWSRIGYYIYAKIAKNRYEHFGVCSILPENKIDFEKDKIISKTQIKWYLIIFKIIVTLYIVFRFPIVSDYTQKINFRILGDHAGVVNKYVKKVTYNFGFDMPIVFNETDLEMNEKWFVLYKIIGDEKIRINLCDKNGGREDLIGFDFLSFTNHGSDLLYFGTTLKFRRKIIDIDVKAFCSRDSIGYNLIKKVAIIDNHINSINSSQIYYFEIFQDNSIGGYSDFSKNIFDSHVIYSDTIKLNI